MKTLQGVVCAIGALLIPAATQAITITNVTTNAVLFYDDFEGVTPVSTVAAPDASGDFDPVAVTGSYLYDEASDNLVQVTNFNNGTGSGPGAIQGNKYLRLTTGGQETQSQITSTPSSGDHINVKFMAYFPSFPTTGNLAVFKFRNGGLGDDSQRAGARATPGGVVADLNGDPTSLTYLTGQWQKWEFDYVIDASTYTMSVGGVSSGPISNLTRGGPGNVQGLGFWQGSADDIPFFLDAVPGPPVPEPSSCALMACGLFGFLAHVRRRRCHV